MQVKTEFVLDAGRDILFWMQVETEFVLDAGRDSLFWMQVETEFVLDVLDAGRDRVCSVCR